MNVAELWQAGRTAWPRLDVDVDTFDNYVDGKDAASERAGELYLACACLNGVPGALEAFDKAFLVDLARPLRRVAPTAELVDEVRQRLREQLFVRRKLADWTGRGPLAAWVRVAAVRLALNLQRGPKPVSDDVDVAAGRDPEIEFMKLHDAGTFREILRAAVGALEPRLRSVLRLYFADGLHLEQIAAVEGVHRATAARWLSDARDELRKSVEKMLREELRLGGPELQSLIGVVRSRLDISLRQLLS